MLLYTFILEYKGGTYIAQIQSPTIEDAPLIWAKNLIAKEIWGLGKRGKEKLIAVIQTEKPVSLQGLQNVWCIWTTVHGKSALINFIATRE